LTGTSILLAARQYELPFCWDGVPARPAGERCIGRICWFRVLWSISEHDRTPAPCRSS
jgi:hypothetical protein